MKPVDFNTRKISWRMPAVKLSECAFLRPAVHSFCRLRAKCDRYTAVNTLCKGEKKLTARFLAHKENKSDGFLLLDQGEKGLTVFLVDGGLATGESLQALLDLRAKILTENGLANKLSSPRYKLNIILLISHFHIDHVNETIHSVLPCRKFLRVKAAYYAAPSVFTKDKNHYALFDGDLSHRPNLLRVAACYQPMMEKHMFDFGETGTLPLQSGELQFFAPPRDWGERWAVDFFAANYYDNDPQRVYESCAVGVVNANSLWVRLSAFGYSLLLTGDTSKKYAEHTEALDDMIAAYGEALRSDIVKMPHHGLGRNMAAPLVQTHLLTDNPDACIVLTALKGERLASNTLRELNAPFACNGDGEIAFEFSKNGFKRL